MSYLYRIKEEFQDKSIFHAWAEISRRMRHQARTLVHPCAIPKKEARKLIPIRFDVDEILELVNIRQKEIARRLNISKLSGDRPSGMLGQSALFEVLRDKGFDFKGYIDGFYENWRQSHREGHLLLMLLGYIHYLRRFFGQPPVDLVKIIVEPITTHQLALTWDENWVTRILMNSTPTLPNNICNRHIYEIVRRLMLLQDARGMTVSRVMEWTGVTRSHASRLIDIIRSSWVEHRYRIVSKNTGTVKLLAKSKSSSNTMPSFHSVCKSFRDGENYFLSLNDIFRTDADERCIEMEAWNTNIANFDLREKVWKLNPSHKPARSVDDIYALLPTGDHKVPDNSIPPTHRDLLFIALLTGADTICETRKRQIIMDRMVKGYGIPKREVEIGVRNVLRKNMVRDQYTHYGIADFERDYFNVVFDDKPRKTIPFLGEVVPSFMWFWLQTDAEMGYGHIFSSHPTYLSGRLRTLIESSMKEHDVNGELFLIQSWGYGHPGSILQLIPDE